MALPRRKSLRQFQCNATLWVTFRRMAEDQEKEVDDMIADAMEAYAQLSGYQTGINALESESQLTPPPSTSSARPLPVRAANAAAGWRVDVRRTGHAAAASARRGADDGGGSGRRP